MRLVYNPRVQQDVAEALRYYDQAASDRSSQPSAGSDKNDGEKLPGEPRRSP